MFSMNKRREIYNKLQNYKSCSSPSTWEIVHNVGNLKKKVLATFKNGICK